MITRIHDAAGGLGFLTILLFWTSTVVSELFASETDVAAVKSAILWGMFALIPMLIVAGGSGMAMGRSRTDLLAVAKKRRMPVIAGNGLFLLIPCAFFLQGKASAGQLDTVFYTVQAIELVAGALNLSLMGLNIRDGMRMTGRLSNSHPASDQPASIGEIPNGPLMVKNLPRLTGSDGEVIPVEKSMVLCRCGASKSKPFCDYSHTDIGFNSDVSNDRTSDRLIAYEGHETTIYYNRLVCTHAGECGHRLKSVFDSARKPWIDPDQGGAAAIQAVVSACPSGALSWSKPGGTPEHIDNDIPGIRIERNGPFLVSNIDLTDANWAEGASPKKYALCRCGASKNKPYCDGSHAKIGWTEAAD
ncbi:CDGSH iron-sulfur domain-containing protein [Roseibium sp. SCPC15]|uniref:CDGSH iron-sulfur domain-containing protein n=1 Tax=Roseibium sp. SCP15 TaxID=3141376 RepID=UPI003339A432